MKIAALPGVLKGLYAKYKVSPILKWGIMLFWAAGFSLVFWLIYTHRLELWGYLEKANYLHLLGFLFFYSVSFCFGAVAWAAIMRTFSPEISFISHIRIFCITLASRRLPGTVWYIGGRALYYKELNASLLSVSLASLLEMISWVNSGFLIGLFLIPGTLNLTPIFTLILRVSTVLLFLVYPPLLTWGLRKVGRPLQQPLGYRKTLGWLLLTAGGWLGGGGMVIELVRSLTPVSLVQSGYILGVWAISGALGLLTIFLPSSFGVTDISLASMLSVIFPLSLSVVVSLLTKVISILIEYVISFFFYIFKGHLKQFKNSTLRPEKDPNSIGRG